MRVGEDVEVRTRFDDSWAPGFEIAEVIEEDRYRVRRRSDGTVLPTVTARSDVRPRPRGESWDGAGGTRP